MPQFLAGPAWSAALATSLLIVSTVAAVTPEPTLLATDEVNFWFRAEKIRLSSGDIPQEWPYSYSENCSYPTTEKNLLHMPNKCSTDSLKGAWHGKLSLSLGLNPSGRDYPLGTVLDYFNGPSGGEWQAYRVNSEDFSEWEKQSPLLWLYNSYNITSFSQIVFRAALRRDYAAWHDDPLGSGLPTASSEVDINEPKLAYLDLHWDNIGLILGRFPVHWSPNWHFGLGLSRSVPYHDGILARLKIGQLNYHYLVSSLNPWLAGTPAHIGDEPPTASERYRQLYYSDFDSNAHRREFAAMSKTLFAHRISWQIYSLQLGITEMNMVGGKSPSLRDGSPFILFHNNYGSGYSKNAISADASLALPFGFHLLSEMRIDDINYSDTETSTDTPTLLGYQIGAEHVWANPSIRIWQGMFFVKTDPFQYNSFRPLTSHYAREVYKSNYYDLQDRPFVDTYIIDHPLGYFRGADALDFWYMNSVLFPHGFGLESRFALLQKGENDAATPFESYVNGDLQSPSGQVEKEWNARIGLSWSHAMLGIFRAGTEMRKIEGENHIAVTAIHNRIEGFASWNRQWLW